MIDFQVGLTKNKTFGVNCSSDFNFLKMATKSKKQFLSLFLLSREHWIGQLCRNLGLVDGRLGDFMGS